GRQKDAIARLELAAKDCGHRGHAGRKNRALGVFQNRKRFFEGAPGGIAPTRVLIRSGRVAGKKEDTREHNGWCDRIARRHSRAKATAIGTIVPELRLMVCGVVMQRAAE